MANYYGIGRSNYVRVTDEEAFREAAGRLNCGVIQNGDLFGLMDSNDDGGGFYFYDGEEDEDLDPAVILSPLLAEGEVMVLMEAGHEKYRYVSGWAQAFDRSGERVEVSLNDIYRLAKERFPGASVTEATY